MRHTSKSLLALLIAFVAFSSVNAHGPSLKVDQSPAVPGETITVKGEGIGVEADITLTLQGILQDYALGSVPGDNHGRFEMRITIPDGAEPGDYTLIAAAGSQKATAKLRIVAAPSQDASPSRSSETTKPEEHGEHEDAEASEEAHARKDAMEIQRTSNALETTLAWAVILGSLLIGLALLVTGRAN